MDIFGITKKDEIGVEFRDEREDLIGPGVMLDHAAMKHAIGDFQIPMIVPKIIICAQLPTPEMVDKQMPGWLETDEEGLTINLLVSDRFTYSDNAMSRLNRNLIHLLRMSEVFLEFETLFPPQVAVKVVELAQPVLYAEAYQIAKIYCKGHDELPIKAIE